MRTLIISGGEMPTYNIPDKIVYPHDMVICADYGCHHARQMGLSIDVAIGDFDSYSAAEVSAAHTITLSPEKDDTDTAAAITYALEHGATEILLLGATGGRTDHFLANIYLLRLIHEAGAAGTIYDGASLVGIISDRLDISGKKDDLLSLIPLTDNVTGITTGGLYYPLHDFTMKSGMARGISNVLLGDTATVSITGGLLLYVHTPINNL